MIGVLAPPDLCVVVAEFFELFKTPWEWAERAREYDVLLAAVDTDLTQYRASLILLYSGDELNGDRQTGLAGIGQDSGRVLKWNDDRIPIYGKSRTFRCDQRAVLQDECSGGAALVERLFGGSRVARVGYDLFAEVQQLLTIGQPEQYARIPTLELHIALLRSLILGAGIVVIEIPPVPAGYRSITCLTHDVDHPSIRRHTWDHTMLGFLRRAVLDSLINRIRGRISWGEFMANWCAALKLPLVYIGLAQDFWADFAERYLEAEPGIRSTYFVIPFDGYAGQTAHGAAPKFRAARYAARHIAKTIQNLMAAGCEVGLHGLDAWRDSARAGAELEEIRCLTGAAELGTRMHWLYYDSDSPVVLERAGASWDSTVGYRETVGYRVGTGQAYKPLHVQQLLEIPLQVMDTALFYPAYMDLSAREGATVLRQFADNASRFGGCLVVNWHDRSLAPERLWCSCYQELIGDLKGRETWFATCSEAAAWFRKRRSVVFERNANDDDIVEARVTGSDGASSGLMLRTYNPLKSAEAGNAVLMTDAPLKPGAGIELALRPTV